MLLLTVRKDNFNPEFYRPTVKVAFKDVCHHNLPARLPNAVLKR